MNSVITLGALALLSFCVEVWSYNDGLFNSIPDRERKWHYDRRSYECGKVRDKCYSTEQCCKGYVCAAFDDFSGTNPDMPGVCVKEKDLEPCVNNEECGPETRCIKLGISNGRYCVPRPREEPREQTRRRFKSPKSKGGLGMPCTDNSDCRAYSEDGKDPLCCQRVKMGRLGVKVRCDRVNRISSCIAKK